MGVGLFVCFCWVLFFPMEFSRNDLNVIAMDLLLNQSGQSLIAG